MVLKNVCCVQQAPTAVAFEHQLVNRVKWVSIKMKMVNRHAKPVTGVRTSLLWVNWIVLNVDQANTPLVWEWPPQELVWYASQAHMKHSVDLQLAKHVTLDHINQGWEKLDVSFVLQDHTRQARGPLL